MISVSEIVRDETGGDYGTKLLSPGTLDYVLGSDAKKLVPGTEYRVRVSARNAHGLGAFANSEPRTETPREVPDPPAECS